MPFDFDSLPEEDAARVRRITERISGRDMQRRRAWMGDGHDLFRVREIIAGTRFEAWVKEETPFGVRTAYNLADAAKMIFDAAGSAKFADLPPIKPSVAYLLAAATTPPEVRNRFLPRLIEGTAITLKEVRAALPSPDVESKPQQDADTESTPMREPSRDVIAFAKGLRLADRRLIRSLAHNGQLDLLVRALDWLDADPSRIGDATADRLSDHAAGAIVTTPTIEVSLAEAEADDEDEDLPPMLH